MKKIELRHGLIIFLLLLFGKTNAQLLNCNDLLYISLDQSCMHTIVPEEVLEGTFFSNCIVELDKVAPFGNGPWSGPQVGQADVNKTYQVRVRHLPSGNQCWGSVTIEDKLGPVMSCNGLSTVELPGGGQVSVPVSNLSATASDNCSTAAVTPGSFQFDCNNLGIETVQLTATDGYGNTSTCSHTILVTSPVSCQSCVSTCPQSVVVSYDEGNIDLLTAFQNNDLAAFDVYGDAVFSSSCMALDSFSTVDYHVGTASQSWFSRLWLWVTSTGQIVNCEQIIAFPRTHTVTVQGNVYLDTDDDCMPDAGEQSVQYFHLEITKSPSGLKQFVFPDAAGNYSADISFNVQDDGANLHLVLPSGVNTICPNALYIPNTTSVSSYQFDIGLQSEGDCPQMQVDLSNLFLRRCATNVFNINYCNFGLDTAYGAFVTLNLDSLIHLEWAELPYTVSGSDSIYTFQLGDVPPFHCSSIALHAMVDCATELGQTLCSEVHIFPDTLCSGPWSGALVEATADCAGDSVTLSLKNIGDQDMLMQHDYIVVEDFIMYQQGSFQLNAGDSILIKTEANGATWRIETPQVPGSIPGLVAAAVEGCGGINNSGVLNIYGQSNNPNTYDEYCGLVIGSFDPNDKTAVPVGYSDQHIIRANEFIEYKIRFQNTGTDTAFKVVVVDTLPAELDLYSLEVGASSHPYKLEIYPGGILHFVFSPIALPDSNVNEVASHGYVNFRIAQQKDLPDGTRIENSAAIYFDQNDPVITNVAFHTIGYPFIANPPIVHSDQVVAPSCSGASDGSIQLTVSGGIPPYNFVWSDPNLQGASLSGLPAGTYEVTFTDSYRGKFVQTFELVAPDPVILSMSSTPALGNDNDGTATAQAAGGSGNFSYLWSTGAVTESLSGLATGTYTVTVTDANGCSASGEVVVSQTILPLTFVSLVAQPDCFGAATGAISVTVSGGLMPYTFQWNDPNLEGPELIGLSAGLFSLTVTDDNGSQFEETFQLNDPAPILILVQATPTTGSLNNGTASATASGGAGIFTYLWSTGATTESISGLAAGVYTVVATDANGCTQSETVEVQQVSSSGEPGTLAQIKVWPNPAYDQITLDLQQVLPQLLRLDLLGMDGRLLQQLQAEDLKALMTLEIAREHSGRLLLVVLRGKDGSVVTEKVVVK